MALLAAACSVHRTPAWDRPTTAGAADPAPEELVQRSREAFRRGMALPGRPGLDALDDAIALAEQALAERSALFRDKVKRRERPSWLFSAPERADVPALVAYGEALLAWSRRHGTGTLLAEQDRIREALLQAWKIDRDFDHAAPDRLLGTLLAILPVGSGADYVHAREHFEAAVAADPSYLPSKLDYAIEYAARMREDVLYRRLIDEVAAADPAQLPPPEADNRAAHERAVKLRAAVR